VALDFVLSPSDKSSPTPHPPSKKKVARFFYTCLSSEAKAKRKKASTEKIT